MTVRLTWGNTNPNADSVIIYRASAPFAVDALPAALTTLPGNAFTYDDTTAPRNALSYYRAKITRGSDVLVTPQMIMGHFPDTGPGPQVLLRGDWNLGYFGRVPVASLWTIAAFRTAIGGTSLPAAGAESTLTFWHKFVRNGKILFIPSAVMAGAATTWAQLYALGLIYGTNDNGAVPTTLTAMPTPVNQQKIITLNGYNFSVRTPLGCTLPVGVIQPTYASALNGSEWDETMGRSYQGYSFAYNAARFDDNAVGTQTTLTQHLTDNTKNCVIRGTSGVIDSSVAANTWYWVPFVELIPT